MSKGETHVWDTGSWPKIKDPGPKKKTLDEKNVCAENPLTFLFADTSLAGISQTVA